MAFVYSRFSFSHPHSVIFILILLFASLVTHSSAFSSSRFLSFSCLVTRILLHSISFSFVDSHFLLFSYILIWLSAFIYFPPNSVIRIPNWSIVHPHSFGFILIHFFAFLVILILIHSYSSSFFDSHFDIFISIYLFAFTQSDPPSFLHIRLYLFASLFIDSAPQSLHFYALLFLRIRSHSYPHHFKSHFLCAVICIRAF